MESKEYYLGLDMGTNSVGWAVTDSQYNIMRAKGKDMWGVREFEEAATSAERRGYRTSRRRRQREQVRIGLLSSLFEDEIAKVDPQFLSRLENSKYFLEDKAEFVKTKNGIFNDDNYKDADYYKEFPTVFHLRSELLNNPKEHDVRLVYLALLNMFKHRGHFLNVGLGVDDNLLSNDEKYTCYKNLVEENTGVILPEIENDEKIFSILGSREYSRTKKKEKLAELLGVNLRDKTIMPYINLICGLKVPVKDIIGDIQLEDDKYSICFNDAGYEDKVSEIISFVGDDNYQMIESGKQLFDAGILSGILGKYSYLSDARVSDYRKHHEDLAILKKVIKKYCSEEAYDELFRKETEGSYSAYIGSVNVNNRTVRRGMKGRKTEDLYKKIKGYIKEYTEDSDVNYIINEMDKETFLPKQITSANGTIPNQVYVKELNKILENASDYLEFLNVKDESGLTVKERISKLFSFHIPYYIGPVTEKSMHDGGNGWVVRKEEGEILPWNISDKIDIDATSEEFIMRLVRECTYLSGEKVLPKGSMLYEKFCVLNEINNIKIDGNKIPVELKQDIYCSLFESGKKITRKKIEDYLIKIKKVINDPSQLSGIDIAINNSLSTFGKFLPIFGEDINKDSIKNAIEDIVKTCTIYGESKELLYDKLCSKYCPDLITENQLKRIVGMKFKDWGRMSKEFLFLPGAEKSTREIIPLIEAMWNTNLNLMELINSDEYTYKEELESRRKNMLGSLSELKHEDLDEMYFSAPVKRMVWQTLLIIKEIEKVMGSAPKRVFVEMTRNEQEKRRTNSRKQRLKSLFENIKEEVDAECWSDIIDKADANGSLKSKKLYLYITQLGKCMYSGESIDLGQLDNYDIDHIYPQSRVKDDNLDNNMVLVKRQLNIEKGNSYPIKEDIYKSQFIMWQGLHKKGLINDEKYKRLTCRSPFTDEQLAGFIARQLVETSQGTKGVTQLLKQLLPAETQIVYSKASNVAEFRHKNELLKSRAINDYHHAHDAYLNIVVGNVYFVKFTQNPKNFIKSDYIKNNEEYHLSKMFERTVKRNTDIAWTVSKNGMGSIDIVRQMLAKNTPLITKMTVSGHGALFNIMPITAKEAKTDNYVPLKTNIMSDVKKYGGYGSLKPGYFVFIEYKKGNKRIKAFDVVPLMYSSKIDSDESLIEYFEKKQGYEDVRIICNHINKYSLIKMDGFFLRIVGFDSQKRVELHNATSLCAPFEIINYVNCVEKSSSKDGISNRVSEEQNIELYKYLLDKHNKGTLANSPKTIGNVLEKGLNRFAALELGEQVDVLNKLLSISALGGASVGLKEIGGPSSDVGRIRISGNMTDRKELILIYQSVTGVYESKMNLLEL